jgi:hypothetical protein
VQGRYLRVQLSGANYLTLAEFQVYGTAGAAPSITAPSSLPSGTVGSAYPATAISASGGTGVYTWSATGLPGGLSINTTTGVIAGTPLSATGSPFNVNITVTDSALASASRGYSLTVTAPSGGSNLALFKTAAQSSTYPGATTGPSSAVDGNTDGTWNGGSLTHTNFDTNAWWQVDLGSSASISSVTLWNRTECCGDRLSDFWVFVSDTPFLASDTPATLQTRPGTFSSHQTSAPMPSTTIPLTVQGRYVRVQLTGTNYLSLAEVQVMGR